MLPFPVLAPALPEIILVVGALCLVLLGAIQGDGARRAIQTLSVGLLIVVLGLVHLSGGKQGVGFEGAFIADGFAQLMKVFTLIASIATLLMSFQWLERERVERYEYSLLVLLATLGMMMMISANDLIALYIGLELQSLALYVVAAIHRDNSKATEAGLKYFVLGALSSGMLLYGASLIYGFAGTTSFSGIAAVVKGGAPLGVVIGLVFLLAGMAFKISAVPFHMWTPDVYEGAPTPVAAFFSAGPKMAAMAMFVRVVITAFPAIAPQWQQIVIFISIASMALGAFAAIGQTNIKRLLAYSSIANMGYALVGLAAGTPEGVQGVITYMAIYLVTTLGSFGCVLLMRRDGQAVETIGDLAGLSRTRPWLAFSLAAMMFSLAGIPPLAGFWAKFYVFGAAINAKLFALAIIGVVTSVVGAYYYLRIVKLMYFDEPKPAFDRGDASVNGVVIVCTIFVALLSIAPAALFNAAAAAARSLF
ncbi:MAG: NADH-quinone oxidoreductase subunit N [Rhizobiales bacterium 65-9]|nr:NADH-quinone oxidoreductase subunit NuoN [Hyphomicrobiales bacterium]OJY35650.1 MAG: NADH-quinone oxidoreductase subunit N [Rhizobiales bacterium 65-9]